MAGNASELLGITKAKDLYSYIMTVTQNSPKQFRVAAFPNPALYCTCLRPEAIPGKSVVCPMNSLSHRHRENCII